MFSDFAGLTVIESPLARRVFDEVKVEKWAINKRRKRWRVVIRRIDEPVCYQVGNILYMHPELVSGLHMHFRARP